MAIKMVIYTLNLPWMLIEPMAYGGFMMLVLLNKIEDIYIFNPTNLHQKTGKKPFKTISNITHSTKLIRNSKKKTH